MIRPKYQLVGDGKHDDTAAMQAYLNGKTVFHRPSGKFIQRGEDFPPGNFLVSAPLDMGCRQLSGFVMPESDNNFWHSGPWTDEAKQKYREWLSRTPEDHPARKEPMPWDANT